MNRNKLSVFLSILFFAGCCNIGKVFASVTDITTCINKSLFYGTSSAAQSYRDNLQRQQSSAVTQVSDVNERENASASNEDVQSQIKPRDEQNEIVNQQLGYSSATKNKSIMEYFHVPVSGAREVFVGKKGKPVQVVAIAAVVAAVSGLIYYAVKKSDILLTKKEKLKKLALEKARKSVLKKSY